MLCAEPKEHKRFRPGARPGGIGFPAGRIGDRRDREIVYVPNDYVPFPAPNILFANMGGGGGQNRGGTNRVFGKPCFCPLPKRGHFDENGENDEFAFYPLKTRVWLLRPPKTTKMTKMAGVTQEKAWFRKSLVCSSLWSELSSH